MKVTGEVNTSRWAFDPLEPGSVVAQRPDSYGALRNYVSPGERAPIVPSRHEVIDPYAHAPALAQADVRSVHTYTPESRARAMIVKTSAVTVALSILTAAAMIVFVDDFLFLWWLVLASAEWVLCFLALAMYDYKETPAADVERKTKGYLRLMEREQDARLRALYGE